MNMAVMPNAVTTSELTKKVTSARFWGRFD
jgi:hypothetical protein